jgi:heme exporter protein A
MFTGKPEPSIQSLSLGKRFGARWVLRGVSFDIRPGEAVGLCGDNGSGKSTVLRILATLLRPNAGTALINTADILTDSTTVRAKVGYLAHTPGLYDDLTARENLCFAADMLGVTHSSVNVTLERVALDGVANDRVRGFSAGMQRRLALARLMLRRPDVLLLDEPYSNLDAKAVEIMNALIADTCAQGGSALIALHELAPARAVLDRALILVDGRIAAADAEFTGSIGSARVAEAS